MEQRFAGTYVRKGPTEEGQQQIQHLQGDNNASCRLKRAERAKVPSPGLGTFALSGRVFKNRIKIWYKKWCYIGVSKLLIFNTLIYKIVLCKFA